MHVGASYTRIYVIYVYVPTNILRICVNRRIYVCSRIAASWWGISIDLRCRP